MEYTFYSSLRVAQFLGQRIFGSWLIGQRPSEEDLKILPPVEVVLKDLKDLFAKDLKNIETGIYKRPRDLLPSPLEFSKRSLQFFADLYQVKDRSARRAVKEFRNDFKDPSLPSYFTQNFHFQTDGYLSDESAGLYDHQVELVFGGGADAMRRQALVPLQKFYSEHWTNEDKVPLKLLDLACGTGRFLREVKDNFPTLRLTGADLSPFYLKKARENLSEFTHVDFVECQAEALPFKDNHFDVLTCIFLFHELPRRIRGLVAQEMYRVLKKGGLLIFIDSLQLGDKPALDNSLKLFPKTYHEPYYLDFIEHDLDGVFTPLGFQRESSDLAFFSKVLSYKKLSD